MRFRASARSAAERKAWRSFWKNSGGRQRVVGEVAGRRRSDSSLRGSTGAAEWIGLEVVTERVLGPVDQGQFGKAVAVAGGVRKRRFEDVADLRVFLSRDALPVAEGAQHGLMSGVLTGASAAQ